MNRKIFNIVLKLVLIFLGVIFLYPIIWMIILSFKDANEIYRNPFGLPEVWLFSNYPRALSSYNFVRYFTNSLIYTVSTVIITIILASMFAYCVSRMRWKFSKFALNYIILGMVVPIQVVIIPIFMILKYLHIRNTYLGLILPYTAFSLASSILILYAFFRTVPSEMEEAACMDGCNIYSAFFRIMLPIVKPALVTVVIIVFMNNWNEFFMAFILTNSDKIRPLTVGLLNFFVGRGLVEWGMIGATMVVSSLPTIIVYLLFSEQIENALTVGAVLK